MRGARRLSGLAVRGARRLSGLAGAIALTGGCASSPAGAPPAVSAPGPDRPAVSADGIPAGDGWIRRVAPFDVLDENGRPYEIPFLGGFNVPRPQWVDIDDDGDLDLFVQEKTNRLMFFEREDGPAGPRHTWRPDLFRGLDIGEWYRFVDVDGDGDRDLLAETPFSYMRLYRNVGDAGAAEFRLIADTLRDTRGEAIFSDRQNIPNAADIDCDGLLDLFIGRLVGTVTRYEATGAIGETASPFRHITDRFEDIEIVADPAAQGGVPGARRIPPGGNGAAGRDGSSPERGAAARPTLHGANTMALADVDADGDTDMFWGDFFEPGLLFIENAGSCASPNLRTEPRPFPLDDPIQTSGYNAPTFGDADGDGDLDLLMGVLGGAYNANTTTADNLLFFRQIEGGAFRLETERFLSQIDVGSESFPALADLDGDGDLDLVVTNKIDPDDLTTSHVYVFENTGDARRPAFRRAGELSLAGAYHNAPAFGDLDGDGDLDAILGTWRKELRLLENTGTRTAASFTLADSAFLELTRGSNAAPTLGDVDGDGDLDLFVGESSGALNFYENVGSPDRPAFELVSDEFGGFDVGRRSVPQLVDADGDGDLDLAVGTESGGFVYFENRGGPTAPEWVPAAGPLPSGDQVPIFATPAFGDLDGDGDLDLLTGGIGGGVLYFERR